MTLLHRVILVVLVALLPALAAEVYDQQALRTAERAELDQDALREARAVAAELRRILDGTRDAMVVLSALPAILSEDGPQCGRLLQSIRGRLPAISVLTLVAADDRVVCSSAPGAVQGAVLHIDGPVRLARARGDFAVAGYLFSHWTDSDALATARPVLPEAASGGGGGGGVGPVLVADLGLDRLGRQLLDMARQAKAHLTVVDARGVVLVAGPDGPKPGTPLPEADRGLLAPDQPPLARVVGPGGASHTVAVARLPELSVLAWLDDSAAAAAQRRAGLRSDAMLLAGLVAALAVAVGLACRTVTAPMAGILDTVTRWRAGEAGARVDVHNPATEFGRIGAALNELLAAFARTEAGLRTQQTELERRVAERTAQLEAEIAGREQAQLQLQQAQRMEVIGRLTGGIAHDFNNLLTAIIGNLELASMRSRERPAVTRLLGSAMRAAERGAALTQRLLAFGRQQYLRLQPTDVAALLAGMDDLLARSIGPTVTLRVAVEDQIWPALADPAQLELVLLNLAINARDAMPDGGMLGIAAASETVTHGEGHAGRLQPGDYVRIDVCDSGAGMDAATLERVLEPFFTTKPAGKGSGLGLSMAHGVAAQSGGGLAIRSAVGQGTTVSVWLPRSEAAASAPAADPADRPRGAAGPRSGAGRAILLVDDDAAVADVTRRTLLAEGFNVLHRADGEAALALLGSGITVDLLLADLSMPGMNGVQLAAAARARRPALPVLLTTGDTGSAALRGGGIDYPVLEKPFRAAQLLRAVAAATGAEAKAEIS